MANGQEYKYFAFISYSSKDIVWGRKLQKKLESYRMPATLCSEHGWKRTPINPVFFAPSDIRSGNLTDELQQELRASRNLIVICSTHSAKSQWVGKEIEYFHHLGRTKQIHFFIVDGEPHSSDPSKECFNPVIERLGLPEILGANINEKVFSLSCLNTERAYVQLISKLLNVDFDSIWNRHKRELLRQSLILAIGLLTISSALFYLWISGKPVDIQVRLNEVSVHNDSLPPLKDAEVFLILENEAKMEKISSITEYAQYRNIPYRFLGKKAHIQIAARDYLQIDTIVVLNENLSLEVKRDPAVYGNVRFRIWDPQKEGAVSGATVFIDGHSVTSDTMGLILHFVPLERQRPLYRVESSIPLLNDTVYMPCGPDDILIVK